jgi:SM-20-related protein
MFQLNPALDRATLTCTFAARRRVQIRDFLAPDSAAELHAHLRSREDWKQVLNSDDKVFDLDRPTRAGMSAEHIGALDDAVYAGARIGFQYRFETIRMPDDDQARAARDDLLTRFARWLSDGEARELLRQVVGQTGIDFVDAQGTAYSPGDFLTSHDDAVEGKGRLAAYVYNLTPQWRPEWGGLLLFHDEHGDIDQGLTPRFNVLNIFAVPQMHSVSIVSRAAPFRRYSITGWLRTRGSAGQGV